MNKLFSGMLLASDLDGTLLDSQKQISHKNMEAIEYFCENGGRFVVATGRAIRSATRYLDRLPGDMPAILFNGSALYDYQTKQILWEITLPPGSRDHIARVMEAFPQVGVEILVGEEFFVPQDHPVLMEQRRFEQVEMTLCSLSEVPDHWYKVLFGVHPADMAAFQTAIRQMEFTGVHYAQSSDFYYEMLPQGVSKGAALQALVKQLGIPREQIIAVGDQENDIEMLTYADIGFAVANASEQLQQAADHITCSNDEDAIAAVVEWLKARQKG